MRATLVIPTLNEAEGIGRTLTTFRAAAEGANRSLFLKAPVEWEIIVVDGASSDGTQDIARRLGAKVIDEPRRGYGRAYKTGFEHATGDYVATLDGDGTYPADMVPWFLLHLLYHQKDFLTGDRLTYLAPKSMTTEHRIGNLLLNLTVSVFFHSCLQGVPARVLVDSQSGFWVFRRSALGSMKLHQDGMSFSEEIKLEAMLRGLKFEEVPIHYAERWGRPKLSSWRDGLTNWMFLLNKRFQLSQESRMARRLPVAQGASAPQGPA
ncbi:MAG: glycosyltransferase family 2 protein [Euryarchaeota archaeon]|nr:glycosyltransferase family 2 protein [Euryarchaeota archaeon]MDE1837282.1 glycosyltransferase family 2 protein [Euryarchaeota archaeon]MDE1879952.1 glycosyltransferase family 2 protein [Euryarchaeota archaeon]MDE2045114.1 glycosyltransferase family 2 protein [Thermoplasmata archaeon]